jgi:hypothetical protein
MGISHTGIGAYEQMIVGRVVLYDRLYYHHKVRAADAMAQRLVQIAEDERGSRFTVEELFFDASDDTMVELLGGRLSCPGMSGGKERAQELASRIRERRLYHRALAFAARFVSGMEGFQEGETRDSERAALWRQVTKSLASFENIRKFEKEIFETSKEVAGVDERLCKLAQTLQPEHVIVDLPANKTRPGGNLLLTRTEDDEVGLPNLYFDPERWSNAYDQQKRCGYVFCPREYIPLVSLSSRVAIFRRYRFGVTAVADRFTKTVGKVQPAWFDWLAERGIIDVECHQQLREERVFLSRILPDDIRLPAAWIEERPELRKNLAEEIIISRPGGFVAPVKEEILTTLASLGSFVQMINEGGEYAKLDSMPEAQLQADARRHLRTQGLEISEGSEVGGGETDLLVGRKIIIENKIAGETNDPMSENRPYPFQARRYSIALCKTVFFTLVAYKPRSELGVLRQSSSVSVRKVPDVPEDCLEIRLVVPYGTGRPSAVSKPVSGF